MSILGAVAHYAGTVYVNQVRANYALLKQWSFVKLRKGSWNVMRKLQEYDLNFENAGRSLEAYTNENSKSGQN